MSSHVARGVRAVAKAAPEPPLLPAAHQNAKMIGAELLDVQCMAGQHFRLQLAQMYYAMSFFPATEHIYDSIRSPPEWCNTFQGFSTLDKLLRVGPTEVPPKLQGILN